MSKKAFRGPKRPTALQPAFAALAKRLRSHRDQTVVQLARYFEVEPHTIRSMMSRLNDAGANITKTRHARKGWVYRIDGGAK